MFWMFLPGRDKKLARILAEKPSEVQFLHPGEHMSHEELRRFPEFSRALDAFAGVAAEPYYMPGRSDPIYSWPGIPPEILRFGKDLIPPNIRSAMIFEGTSSEKLGSANTVAKLIKYTAGVTVFEVEAQAEDRSDSCFRYQEIRCNGRILERKAEPIYVAASYHGRHLHLV